MLPCAWWLSNSQNNQPYEVIIVWTSYRLSSVKESLLARGLYPCVQNPRVDPHRWLCKCSLLTDKYACGRLSGKILECRISF